MSALSGATGKRSESIIEYSTSRRWKEVKGRTGEGQLGLHLRVLRVLLGSERGLGHLDELVPDVLQQGLRGLVPRFGHEERVESAPTSRLL